MAQTKEQIRLKRNKYQRAYRKRKPKTKGAVKGIELLDSFNFTAPAPPPSAAEAKRLRDIFELPAPTISAFPSMLDDPDDGAGESASEGFDKNAYQMLGDMRHAYRKGGGRTKLAQFTQSDDRNFVFLVKELMKIESALLSAKIRKENSTASGGNQQNFFVVIKGLEDEPQIAAAKGRNGIDFNQIQQAMDPTREKRDAFDDDVFRDANEAPDMLFGVSESGVDPWEGINER